MGEGATLRDRKRTRVSCEECEAMAAESLIRHHMERTHRKVTTQNHGVDVRGGGRGDICCVITMCPDISGMPGGGVPDKGAQPEKDPHTIHVLELEVQGSHTVGGTKNTTVL